MKKELVAAILLVVILAGCLINIKYMSSFTDELISLINEAEQHAVDGDWDNAALAAELALALWKDHKLYTSIVLPHNEVGQATDALYDFIGEISSQSDSVSASAQVAVSHFEELASQERISLRSVF